MAQYTILRKRPAARSLPSENRSFATSPPREHTEIAVQVQELDEQQASEAANDPDNILAPNVEIKLIKPLGSLNQANDENWGIEAIGGTRSTYNGAGVTVAVLDTGIDRNHAAFQGMSLVERDFTGEGDGDEGEHGTHCAGVIFGRPVGGNRIGVAPGIRRALIGKVLRKDGSSSSSSVFEGLSWAIENGAQIISMSLGLDFPGFVRKLVAAGWPIELATSKALVDFDQNRRLFSSLVDYANAGLIGRRPIIIAAAGNESRRAEKPYFKIDASLPSCLCHISVGALEACGSNFRVADFSNSGPTISAPGVDIVSAKAGGGLVCMSGTSMAAPHVAGVAALWVEKLIAEGDAPHSDVIASHLRVRARQDVFVGGRNVHDVGSGLVQAPY